MAGAGLLGAAVLRAGAAERHDARGTSYGQPPTAARVATICVGQLITTCGSAHRHCPEAGLPTSDLRLDRRCLATGSLRAEPTKLVHDAARSSNCPRNVCQEITGTAPYLPCMYRRSTLSRSCTGNSATEYSSVPPDVFFSVSQISSGSKVLPCSRPSSEVSCEVKASCAPCWLS